MTDDHGSLLIRPGRSDDVATVLALLDDATRWLVAHGRTGQWGTEPHSTNPRRIRQVTEWAAGDGLHLAVRDDTVVGALVVGQAMPYVPPAVEPELYVNLLVTSRAHVGQGIGTRLLDHAEQLAREHGVELLRVDCYGGDDRALVRYYERQGFRATEPFTVYRPEQRWPGQLLERRLA